MSDAEFEAMATARCDIYRIPSMSGTPPTRGPRTVVASNVHCLPFDPVSADIIARHNFDRPYELKITYMETLVKEGDSLVNLEDGLTYAVASAAEWKWEPTITVYEVIIRQPKSS